MKCEKCEKEASFFSPANWCDDHWFEWWTEGYTTEERIEARKDFDDLINDSALQPNQQN